MLVCGVLATVLPLSKMTFRWRAASRCARLAGTSPSPSTTNGRTSSSLAGGSRRPNKRGDAVLVTIATRIMPALVASLMAPKRRPIAAAAIIRLRREDMSMPLARLCRHE